MSLPDNSTAEQKQSVAVQPLRMGILGAARIAPNAIVEPARQIPDIQVLAIAARDPERGRRFAAAHQIPRLYTQYDDLIADPDIDAIYIPLPNALHRRWTINALNAGKHVLCEKPLAANTHEAHQMVAAARENDMVLMEAFHYAFHPLAQKVFTSLQQGAIGAVCHIETVVCIPMLHLNDIRLQFDLAGGATMDVGCYALHMARFFMRREPTIIRARATQWTGQIDRAMEAEMRFADGATGRMICSLFSRRLLNAQVTIIGDQGRIRVINPILPHLYNRLSIQTPHRSWTEQIAGKTTYAYQLHAFVSRIRDHTVDGADQSQAAFGDPGGPHDAIANMMAIDAVYDAAGMARRGAVGLFAPGTPNAPE